MFSKNDEGGLFPLRTHPSSAGARHRLERGFRRSSKRFLFECCKLLWHVTIYGLPKSTLGLKLFLAPENGAHEWPKGRS